MKEVWHIYYATRGAAGAYIDALLRASDKANVPARAFVSASYRFTFGALSKVFFPLTDRSERRNKALRILRGLELALGYTYVTALLFFKRPRVMLHFIDDFRVTYLFFRIWRLMGLEVSLTCHDVGSHYLGMNNMRAHMFKNAKTLVVHNNAARESLIQSMDEAVAERIVCYPFPFSSYDDILDDKRLRQTELELKQLTGSDDGYYLFLGVVRRTKGIEELVEAWGQANTDKKHKLVIAGAWTNPDPKCRALVEDDASCVVIDRYITDEEFALLIAKARFVVLPYHEYAHSSVILSCANHKGAVIISDIGLFTELLPDYPLTHKNRDVTALAATLRRSMKMSKQECAACKATLALAVSRENRRLVTELRRAYSDSEIGCESISDESTLEGIRDLESATAETSVIPSNRLKRTIQSIPAINSYRLQSVSGDRIEFIWDGGVISEMELHNLTSELARQCGAGTTITMRKSASVTGRCGMSRETTSV